MHSNPHSIPRRNHHSTVDNYCLQNNSFVRISDVRICINLLFCVISKVLYTHSATRSYGHPLGQQTKSKWFSKFRNSLQIKIINFSLCLMNVQHYYSCANVFKSVFPTKAYCKVNACMQNHIPYIPCQSLLLST